MENAVSDKKKITEEYNVNYCTIKACAALVGRPRFLS